MNARNARGFTLMEFGFVLVVALGLMLALLAVSSAGSSGSDRATTVQQILRLDQSIRTHYASLPNYADLTNSNVIARGIAPPDLVRLSTDGTQQIRTVEGMPVTIQPSTDVGGGVNEASGASFTLSMMGLTSETCADLARALSPSALRLTAFNASTGAYTVLQTDRNQTINQTTLATGCAGPAYNDLHYVSN